MMGTQKPVFLATITESLKLTEKEEIVKFDNIVQNRETPYNSQTGKFMAPVGGLYQFSVTVMADKGEELHVRLVKNTEVIVNLYVPKTDRETATATIPLVLQLGDTVFVQHNKEESQTISGGHYSSFSGFHGGL